MGPGVLRWGYRGLWLGVVSVGSFKTERVDCPAAAALPRFVAREGELGSHSHTDTTGGGWGYGGSHESLGWSDQRPEYPFDERKKWP